MSPAALLAVALIAAAPTPKPPEPPEQAPRPGFSTDCVITEVYDGDTVVVEFTATARVRLIDCWAPEIRTKDDTEKAKGFDSRNHLAKAAGMQWNAEARRWRGRTPARLHVPFGSGQDIGGVMTLGRVLGSLWLDGDRMSLSALQVTTGHATPAKAQPEGK